MCCNPANGWVDFEDSGLILKKHHILITKNEHEACQLTRTKVPKIKFEKTSIVSYLPQTDIATSSLKTNEVENTPRSKYLYWG